MGNELFCCSEEVHKPLSTFVSTKEKTISSVNTKPEAQHLINFTINLLKPPSTHERLSGLSMPEQYHFQRYSGLSDRKSSLSERPIEMRESHFDKMGSLGKGAFGRVYLVQPKSERRLGKSEQKFAMKVVSKKKLQDDERSVHSLLLERKILATSNCNFIVDLKYAFQNNKSCFFVMGYAPGGDLYSFIQNSHHPDKVRMFKEKGESAPRFVVACVVLALQNLHQSNIMYRDLKPQNVLVFENGYAKLTDFGLAEEQHEGQMSNVRAGTKLYMAPEVIDDGIYNKLIDLWALGVFLHQMVFFKPPFPHHMIVSNKYKKICRKAQMDRVWPGEASEQVKDLIHSLLKVKPLERLGAKGFKDIKSHAFFQDFMWNDLMSMKMQSPLKSIVDIYGSISKSIGEYDHRESSEYTGEDIPHFTYHPLSDYTSTKDLREPLD